MKKIVLAADIGYGNVKAVWGADRSAESEIIFRAIASPISKSSNDEVIATIGRVPIVVDDDIFLVGPDAYKSTGSSILDFDFVARKEYQAFLRGAMHYMFVKTGVYHTINTLAVGLPISNYTSQKSELLAVCKGMHEIPTPPSLVNGLGPTIKVNIENVIVLPQPLGALSIYGAKCALANRNIGSTLIIDPGFKTLDWVFSHDMNVDMHRSGSFTGGVSSLLREISGIVGKKLGVGYVDLIEVEKAVSCGKIFAGGRVHDFTPFIGIVKEAAAKIVDRFFNALDIEREFDSIVLTGGGGKYYIDAIARKFPTHNINYESDAVMDNARGFYLVARGEMP
jgi:plasmid segregation protein ParM